MKRMRRVGCWLSEKKRKKLNFEEHLQLFKNAGIDLVQIDLSQSIECQGPFDLLIHKITDLYALTVEGDESAEKGLRNFQTYVENHPECVILDPLESVQCILNRHTQYQRVSTCEAVKDSRCMIPSFVELDTNNISEIKNKLEKARVTFPIVCKPILAHGSSYAHQMQIIFSEESLKDIEIPCVAQSFVNHNAILYKIIVIGCTQFIIQRPSLRNLYPGNFPTICFDTQEVSKADSDHPLNAVDYANLEDQPVKPDWAYLDQLGQQMRSTMGLDLFGFDVILDAATFQYGVIDVNFFPGFEAIDGFFPALVDHMVKVLDVRDQGGLVNGRLVAPLKHSPQINILNQLNLKARTSQPATQCPDESNQPPSHLIEPVPEYRDKPVVVYNSCCPDSIVSSGQIRGQGDEYVSLNKLVNANHVLEVTRIPSLDLSRDRTNCNPT